MTYKKGDQALYVELTDADSRKRYLIPNELTMLPKLHALLAKFPSVSFVRSGIANITSDPDSSELDSLNEIQDIPAKVDSLYRAHMPDHPDSVDNFVRYSKALIDLIQETEVSPVLELPTGSSAPDTKPSLTDQLRDQVGSVGSSVPPGTQVEGGQLSLVADNKEPSLTEKLRKQVTKVTGSSVPAPRLNVSSVPNQTMQEAQDEFDHQDYVERQLEALHEKIDALTLQVAAPQQGQDITGTQLGQWFAEAAAKVGFDKAFEVLAKRIKGETQDI